MVRGLPALLCSRMQKPCWTSGLVRLAAAVVFVGVARSSFAADLNWKFGSSLQYESGDFGTGTRSNSVYIPFTLKRFMGDWNASVTLPYLSQTSNGQVRNVGGTPVKTGRGRGTAVTTTHSGVGDLVLRGGYDFLREDPEPFDLSASVKVKVPTADRDKGLGTGEFDEGVGLEFGKVIVPNWTFLADLYYTVIGDPPGTDFENQAAVDFGFAHRLQEDWTVTVLFEGSNALVAGEPGPRDLRAVLDYDLGEQSLLFGGLMVGLSDGSPDFGFSLGGSYRF